jgi:hypothetical protein
MTFVDAFAPETRQLPRNHADYLYQKCQRWIRLPQPPQHAESLIAFRDELLRLIHHLPNLAALELQKTVTSRGIADGINFLVLCLYSDLTNRKNIRNPASADGFVHFVCHSHRLEQAVSKYLKLRHTPFYGGIPQDEPEVLLNLEILCQEVYGESIEQVFACSDPVCRWDN